MSKKLSLSGQSRKTVEEVFGDFVISQTAQGLSETTIATYRCHIQTSGYPKANEYADKNGFGGNGSIYA